MRPPTPVDELGATARELSASGEGEPPASFPSIVDKVPVDPPVYLDQTSIAELAAAEPRCSLKCIQAALDRADYDDAAARALARLQLDLDLPASLAAEVLVGVRRLEVFLVLGKRATGAIGAPLLEVIRRERFGADNGALDQITWAAFVLAQSGQLDADPLVLLPRLRRIARERWLSAGTVGLLGWLVSRIADPHLTVIYEEHQGKPLQLSELMGEMMLEVWTAPLDEVIAMLPRVAPASVLPGLPVRAAAKVGRNDACSCGSGKKFKKCCAGRSVPASALALTSRDEHLRELEPRLAREHIARLSRSDLARLSLANLGDMAVIEVMRRWSYLHDWARARQAVDELARRKGRGFADGHLEDVIFEALSARQHASALELLGHLEDPKSIAEPRFSLMLARDEPEGLARLQALALAALQESRADGPDIEFAFALLDVMPALGIAVARGALRADRLLDAEVLLDRIEDVRDDLLLPPGDPARETFAALGGVLEQHTRSEAREAERRALVGDSEELRAKLRDATDRLGALQAQVSHHERALRRAEQAAETARHSATTPLAPEPDRGVLRAKVEELKSLLKERNAERAELRRELAQASESRGPVATHSSASFQGADEDAGESIPGRESARPVLLPCFTTSAAGALRAVPRNVAAEAMRTCGNLAAGDTAVWRGIKQAKDMPRQVLMARIGLHHRMLFRVDGDAMEVFDLVTRESLDTALKRLRS